MTGSFNDLWSKRFLLEKVVLKFHDSLAAAIDRVIGTLIAFATKFVVVRAPFRQNLLQAFGI